MYSSIKCLDIVILYLVYIIIIVKMKCGHPNKEKGDNPQLRITSFSIC